MPQQQIVYWYLRADADHDISTDVIALSIDGGTTWATSGVTYIPTGSLPPRPAAVDAANPPAAGLVGYWFRVLTGPGQTLPLNRGNNTIIGRVTDNPETPWFSWAVYVTDEQ